ncbi:hypothetical protein C1645_879777 [Glomus cerebriforme]|uniref:Uncharacterized protein n=1 Tax=Glomus cerebriforme TaxID=658196 RepID=A0A397SL29_9GLOM|nr:hypothetical protein C1645_879777 [Glomus cerebriforme]
MTAQDMWNLLSLKAQEGEIESLDIPKVTTIQVDDISSHNWEFDMYRNHSASPDLPTENGISEYAIIFSDYQKESL